MRKDEWFLTALDKKIVLRRKTFNKFQKNLDQKFLTEESNPGVIYQAL